MDVIGAGIKLTLLVILFIFGCVTVREESALLSEPAAAQEDCFKIKLKDSIPITTSVEPSYFRNKETGYRVIISYVEKPNIPGEFVEKKSSFANVYYIAYGKIQEESFIANNARMVIDIWIYDTITRLKTCYHWRMTDADLNDTIDSVIAEVFIEDEWNYVNEIQTSPVAEKSFPGFSALYRKCLNYFLLRLNLKSIEQIA